MSHQHRKPEYVELEKVRALNSRDTKRWCKGVEGVQHIPIWEKQWGGWQIRKCSTCGRFLWGYRNLDASNLASELRRIRKERGLTQEQLAERAGTHQGVVSDAETTGYRWKSCLSIWQYERLFTAMGCRIRVSVETEEPNGHNHATHWAEQVEPQGSVATTKEETPA